MHSRATTEGESSQIRPSTIGRAARAAGSHPHLASVLLQGLKSANIYASSGVIRGIPVQEIIRGLGRVRLRADDVLDVCPPEAGNRLRAMLGAESLDHVRRGALVGRRCLRVRETRSEERRVGKE